MLLQGIKPCLPNQNDPLKGFPVTYLVLPVLEFLSLFHLAKLLKQLCISATEINSKKDLEEKSENGVHRCRHCCFSFLACLGHESRIVGSKQYQTVTLAVRLKITRKFS